MAAAITRREMMLAAAAAIAGGQAKPAFFTQQEYVVVDELTELIIPADDHSPGARAAGVAAYIDQTLAESFLPEPRTQWRQGLAPFLHIGTDERLALLRRIAVNESDPKTPAEHFFVDLKKRTVEAYYTSSIGIHQEMQYKGNVYLEQFVGYDVSKPKGTS